MKDFVFRNDTKLFESFGVEMVFEGNATKEQISSIPCETELSEDDVFSIMTSISKNTRSTDCLKSGDI